MWAKLHQAYALNQLARAAQFGSDNEAAMENLRVWSQRSGSAAIPQLLNLWTSNQSPSVRVLLLVLIMLICANENQPCEMAQASSQKDQKNAQALPKLTEAPAFMINLEGLSEAIPLADALAITWDWKATNRRRATLIKKKFAAELHEESEQAELARLQGLADLKRQLEMPLPGPGFLELYAGLERERAMED